MMMANIKRYIHWIWILIGIGSLTTLLYGQDATKIEFTGTVQTVYTNIIVVSGLEVNISDLSPDVVTNIHVGSTIEVTGVIENATITATTIVIFNVSEPEVTPEPEVTAEVTPEMTAEPEMTPEVTAEPEATPEPTNDDDDSIIVIEGDVTAIGINTITVFDIEIAVDPSSSILTEIEIGQTIRIEGNGNWENGTLVVVAVNITVVNIVIIDGGGTINTGGGNNSGGNGNPPPSSNGFSKDACKKGGWQGLSRADGSGFKNQGDCIQYANTGK